MSYPEPRYHEDGGEINAVFRGADTPPELNRERPAIDEGAHTTWTRTRYLATGAPTGRPGVACTSHEFGLYQVDLGPRSGGPSTHFHRTISESFFILSGTVWLYDGGQEIDATAGDFLYVPVGGLHAFGNRSDEPASLLLLFAPGAPREEYFEHVADVGRLSDAERAEFFLRHDTYWV